MKGLIEMLRFAQHDAGGGTVSEGEGVSYLHTPFLRFLINAGGRGYNALAPRLRVK